MPYPRLENGDDTHAAIPPPHAANLDLVLVAGSSQINRIVVSRIAERAGLKVVSETPENAAGVIATRLPGTVILDCGADGRECESLIEGLAAQRLAAGGPPPFVILLSNTNPAAGEPARGGAVDAVVAKPITPDRLQPLIRNMIDRARDD